MTSDQELYADLNTHHIEGFARAALEKGGDWDAAHFDVPLISHIEDNLWVGGCVDGVALPADFKHVVSLYPWERYVLGPDTVGLTVKMYDSAELDVAKIHEVAEYVVGALTTGKTLVHCQAGLNRSNLIAGMALIKMGRSPADAIALLRARRSPVVLCNRAFETFLMEQP